MNGTNGSVIDWRLILAVYGALLSTILTFQRIWEYRLGIKIKIGRGYFTNQLGAPSEPVLLIKASVKGKRPVKICAWGWQIEKGNFGGTTHTYPRDSLPVELKEGNRSFTAGYSINEFKETLDIDEMIGIFLIDDAGKVWKKRLKKRKMLRLLEVESPGWLLADNGQTPHNIYWHTLTSKKRKAKKKFKR